MLELAQLVHQIASEPSIMADSAALSGVLEAAPIGHGDAQALLEVLREFDWQKMLGADVIEVLTDAAGWPDPRSDWAS